MKNSSTLIDKLTKNTLVDDLLFIIVFGNTIREMKWKYMMQVFIINKKFRMRRETTFWSQLASFVWSTEYPVLMSLFINYRIKT